MSTDIKNYIAQYAFVRNANPIPAGTSNAPPADSIKVAYNRAPDGYVKPVFLWIITAKRYRLCASDNPPKMKREWLVKKQ